MLQALVLRTRQLLPWVGCLACIGCHAAKPMDLDGGAPDAAAQTDAGRAADAGDASEPTDAFQAPAPPEPPSADPPAPVIRARSPAQTGSGRTMQMVPPPPCPDPPWEDLQALEQLLMSPLNDPTAVLSELGRTLALDQDTLALSALRDDGSRTDSVVLVFARGDDAWELQATLEPPGGEANSAFGASLALDGDTLAIGTPELVRGAAVGGGSGRVHVFERDAGAWQLETTLTAQASVDGDAFGAQVALSGDTLAVSMHQQLGGVIEVFARSAGGWARKQGLVPPGQPLADTPLFSLVLDGGVLAFGARQSASDLRQAVHVFELRGGTWEPAVTFFGDDPDELFGAALALQGSTLVVGDPQQGVNDDASTARTALGAVYVFERDTDGTWMQDDFLEASYPATGTGFGGSVAVDCDRIVVGNPADLTHASGIDGAIGVSTDDDEDSGAVYAFMRAAAGYELRNYIKSTTAARRHKRFGYSVAASAGRVLVGTDGEEAAYVFR